MYNLNPKEMSLLEQIQDSERTLIEIAKEAYRNRNSIVSSQYYDTVMKDERINMDKLTDQFLKGTNTKTSHHD